MTSYIFYWEYEKSMKLYIAILILVVCIHDANDQYIMMSQFYVKNNLRV